MKCPLLVCLTAAALSLVAGCGSGNRTPQPLSKEEAAKVIAQREQEEAKAEAAATAAQEAQNPGETDPAAPADSQPGDQPVQTPRGTLFIKVMAQPVNDAMRASQQSLQSAVLGSVTGGGNRGQEGESKAAGDQTDQPAEEGAKAPATDGGENSESTDSPAAEAKPESNSASPAGEPAEKPAASDNP